MSMLVSILANIGIIFLNIYILWKINQKKFTRNAYNKKQTAALILLQVVTATCLMNFSIDIMGLHFDFREVLFVISMKYLGTKITRYSIFLIALVRLLHSGPAPSIVNLITAFVLIATLPALYSWTQKHFKDLGQMLVLTFYNMILLGIGSLVLLQDSQQVALITGTVTLLSTIVVSLISNVMSDIQHLTKIATRDELTGLYNARKLQEDLERLSESNKDYALIIIDIDDFKDINDTYGHLVGDHVITELGVILSRFAKENYYFYRYGGEEFVTIVEHCKNNRAEVMAEEILEKIQVTEIEVEGHQPIEFTVSIGVALRSHQEEDLMITFDRADSALYKAKENGKNQIIHSEH